MSVEHGELVDAEETIRRDLAFLKQITDVFSMVFGLNIPEQAAHVATQMEKVSNLYFRETVDSSDFITSLDWIFSELEYEADEFAVRARRLNDSFKQLHHIYQQFVLSQALVMLVSSLEVYLGTVFRISLAHRLGLDAGAVSQIARGYNFQNWGSATQAFRTFLQVELCPDGVEGAEVNALLQRRHVLIHRLGIIDERALRQLRLPSSSLGTRLRVSPSEINKGIILVGRIVKHVSEALERGGG